MVVTQRDPCFTAILLVLHLAEPMCATVIHPFIAQVHHSTKLALCTIGISNEILSQQLILELGVTGGDASKVGYYVGFIVCELVPFIRCTSDHLHF